MSIASEGVANIDEVVAEFEREGVIRLRSFFSSKELTEIRSELERYQAIVLPGLGASERTFEADGATVRNLWRMEQYDDYFANLAKRPAITQLVSRLVHGEPVLMGVETFSKPARIGSEVPWHQDNAYFCRVPADVLTLWIAIDPATIENGAVYYARGEHHTLLPHTPSGVVGNSMGMATPPNLPVEEQFCGELQPGDALIHHCQSPHRSEPNRSDQSRLALLMVFRGAHTRTDSTLQADYDKARELVA
jgi:ectoine hydroxylase-related dioxygenase (phytanoyl-CoA dioxygenase family)